MEDQTDHIGAMATIVSPTDLAQDPTARPLPDYTASSLIDTCSMHNFISRQAVKKAGLEPIKRLSSTVTLINGAKLPIAGVHRETLRITDGNKETRLQAVTLCCADLHGFNIVLGIPCNMMAK